MVGEGTWVRRELGSRAAGSKQSGKLSLAVSMNIGAGAAASRLEVGFGPLEGFLGAGIHGKFLALAPTSNVLEEHSKATCTKSPQISPAVRPSAKERAGALGVQLPKGATPEVIAAIHDRLQSLGEQWRHLEDGAAIKVSCLLQPR